MTRDEIEREAHRPYDPTAIGVVFMLGTWLAKSPEERARVLRDALDAAHAAGLAQGRAEMRERAACVADHEAAEWRELSADMPGPGWQHLTRRCAAACHDTATRIRALPTDPRARWRRA